jgi:uncharacterized membrane protein YfcA
MDLIGLWAYRGRWIWPELRILAPASLIGIAAGTLLFGYMSAATIKLCIGVVAIAFGAHYFIGARHAADGGPRYFGPAAGIAAGAAGGFTSFVAHAGGPPISIYLLRRPLDRFDFVATTVLLFAVINYVKLVPYAWLGQLSAENLATSLVLSPLAPIGVYTGVWLTRCVSDRFFFGFMYLLLVLVGGKLLWDGLAGA